MAGSKASTPQAAQEYSFSGKSRVRARKQRSRNMPNETYTAPVHQHVSHAAPCEERMYTDFNSIINSNGIIQFGDFGMQTATTPCIMFVPMLVPEQVLAASTECVATVPCEIQKALGSPMALLSQPEYGNDVIDRLENGSQAEKHQMLLWLHDALLQLALSKTGCRIVQKAFDVAGGSDRDLIIDALQDHVAELYESPHGNHVLSRAIEVLPAAKNSFVISALRGRCVTVARHRFGCRVICRLIEHCSEDQIGHLLDEIVVEAAALARHTFGNFSVQSMLEHTSPARRSAVLSHVLPVLASLATHRTGSLVAQRVLDYCDGAGQTLALQALLQSQDESCSLVEIACSHYGSYVIEQAAGMRSAHAAVQDMSYLLASNLQTLQASEHAQRVLLAFGLTPREQQS